MLLLSTFVFALKDTCLNQHFPLSDTDQSKKWNWSLHISDATPDINQNIPSQSNDSPDRNNNTINSDFIAKNGKTVLFKNKLLEYLI